MSDVNETTVVVADEPAGRNPLVLVLAALGAVILGALVWFFLLGPLLAGDDADQDVTAAPAATGDVADEPTTEQPLEAPVDEAGELPVVTYEVFLDRDPFDPVVPETTSATAATTDDGAATGDNAGTNTGGTTDGTTTGDTTGGTTGGTTDGTSGGTSPCTTGDQVVCDGRVVSLVDVRTGDDGSRLAVVQVDTTIYEVRVGETFAGSFQVQSIGDDQVVLLYGDDAFTLREGDRVLK